MKISTLIKERNISVKWISEQVHIPYTTLMDKLKGRSEFTVSEAFKIQEHIFPLFTIKELFERESADESIKSSY